MYRLLTIVFILAGSLTYAQNITNTLGASGDFVVKNSGSTELLQISSAGEAVLNGNATINGNVTINAGAEAYTLPTTDGAANQVMKTDGNGNLGWTAQQGNLAVDFLICFYGPFPSSDNTATEPFIGQIVMSLAGYQIPANFKLCNGQVLNIVDYSPLFALIGFTYGGDGHSTFALPNFESFVPIGK